MANFKFYDGSSWIELAKKSDIPSTAGFATTTWVGQNYLSLTGGTLTNNNFPQLTISNPIGDQCGIEFLRGGNTGWDMYISSGNFYLFERSTNQVALEINEATQFTRAYIYGNPIAYTTDIPNLSGYATQDFVEQAIGSLPSPMVFKGTVGDNGTITWSQLPVASSENVGWTYKVVTTNANMLAKVGDTIISDGTSWEVIPSGDEPSGTVTNVAIISADSSSITVTGSPITSSGTITINLADTYGDNNNPYGSKTANYVLAAPNGSAGLPTFRPLAPADIPDLSGSYLPLSGGTMTGLITTNAGSSHAGLKVGETYITAISGDVIFQNNGSIRFGSDSWDYNVWAGLKYVHSDHTIHLGLADNNIFAANSAQSGGILNLPGMDRIQITDVYHRISREDGTTLTRAGGGTLSLPNSSGKGIAILADENGDYGLMYVGSDGAMIANSGDTGYVFQAYDKDVGYNMFGVGQSGVDSFFTGNLNVNGSNLRLASHVTMQYNSTEDCLDFIFA